MNCSNDARQNRITSCKLTTDCPCAADTAVHPNPTAPRCLPCGYEDPLQDHVPTGSFIAPRVSQAVEFNRHDKSITTHCVCDFVLIVSPHALAVQTSQIDMLLTSCTGLMLLLPTASRFSGVLLVCK